MFRKCIKCRKTKETTDYYKMSSGRLRKKCKSCYTNQVLNWQKKLPPNTLRGYIKKYSQTPKGKRAINQASRIASKKFPEKWKARSELRYAVKIGLIKKLNFCQLCEKIKPLQGHHPDYAKPLEVLWLCSGCHKKVHRHLLTPTN